ncbi:MAG: putative toxin-antitoxin system toxin component, PIN family [Pseudorhodoferax sp.]
MKAERAVVDTNVLISAALSAGGPPARLVRHVLQHGRLLFSDASFAELHTRLWRPKFDRYLRIEDRKQLLHDFGAAGVWVDVPAAVAARTFSRDVDDDKFLHLALAGQADLLVSGDLDLLDLGAVEGIAIVTPAQACAGLGI